MLFELYLIDLTPEKRKEFLEAHGCLGRRRRKSLYVP